MDAVDLAILREMFRERVLFWGSLDPRVSTDAIARKVGVAGSTVRARLAAWHDAGFLARYDVLPNPALVGASLGAGNFRVADPRHKPQAFEDLALLEGTVSAQDNLGGWMTTTFLAHGPESLARRLKLLERLPGVAETLPCVPVRAPAPTMAPSPLDWRLLAALRHAPGASLGGVARELGVSTKTAARRYERLVAGRALWFVPELDFGRWRGAGLALLNLYLDPKTDSREVARAVRARLPDVLVLTDSADLFEGHAALAVLVHLGALADAEEAECAALEIGGVREVEVLFPRRFRSYGAWADEAIRAHVA
ncbi:MAG: hypothetical protein QOE90_402 [Thermoplasmata archaeon]|jgi:DNA-binding Lrp family transcriptional regulator|nr:hypothetical protein [Thermoplasmata archaeon]